MEQFILSVGGLYLYSVGLGITLGAIFGIIMLLFAKKRKWYDNS